MADWGLEAQDVFYRGHDDDDEGPYLEYDINGTDTSHTNF